MAFPASPSNLDIHVEGSTPFQYLTAENRWKKVTDANLVAGNIKLGVAILGVTGTYVPTWGTIQTVTMSGTVVSYYITSDGKMALVVGTGGVPIADNHNDHVFETDFAAALGKTLNTYLKPTYWVSNWYGYDHNSWSYGSGVGQIGVCTLITFT